MSNESNEITKKYYLDIEGLATFWNKLKEYIEPLQTDVNILNEKIITIENKLENGEFARMVTVGENGRQSFNIATIKINSSYSVENNTLICESDEIDNTKTLVMSGGIIENNILQL